MKSEPQDGGREHSIAASSSTEALPLAPSLGPSLESVRAPKVTTSVDRRVVFLSTIAIMIGIAAGAIAYLLLALIGLITNLTFYGRATAQVLSPVDNHLGLFVIIVPAIGGVIVGLMARYGSEAIRGHGIPEVMEQILTNQSRIRPRLTFLKPLSAAIAIGTGGPFGAEGPIIATGGALGSVIGQFLKTTADERKILLAAGASAGMAATFGSPVSAVLIAIELLLFEFRPRSVIPVAFACMTATAFRQRIAGPTPIFVMPNIQATGESALLLYLMIGILVGIASVGVTRAVYLIEDSFAELPIHWMWWPALGGIVVGLVGYFVPRTLGVGYYNVRDELSGAMTGEAVLLLCIFKFVSWSISLGSGTSGGTLAPLFTIGGAMGAALGAGATFLLPACGIDVRVAALVGMAAMFAGASRALLASIVFAFETTLQPLALLPLATGCTGAFLISALLMKDTIMTEKIARRGVRVPVDYAADLLDQIRVGGVASSEVVALRADQTVDEARSWMADHSAGSAHHGFPVVDSDGDLLGVVNRRDLLDSKESPQKRVGDVVRGPYVVAFADNTLHEAADFMAREGLGRLAVVDRKHPRKLVGILSGSDVRAALGRRLMEAEETKQTLRWRWFN